MVKRDWKLFAILNKWITKFSFEEMWAIFKKKKNKKAVFLVDYSKKNSNLVLERKMVKKQIELP